MTKRVNRGAKSAQPSASGNPGAESFPIVGIGASAGGLEAFTELLKHLPLDSGMAFVLVQHLDPQHESVLVQLLARTTRLPVQNVTHNLRALANHVYVIPHNTHLTIARGVLKLQPRPKTPAMHRSIDLFFESLAQDQRERAIGVILSGTASDGTLGLEAIKAEGGITFAQDDSAHYDSMPRSAAAAGCVDFVLSPKAIARELTRIAKHPYVAAPTRALSTPEDDRASATAHADDDTALPSGGAAARRPRVRTDASQSDKDSGFKKILLLLRGHSGVDFSLYKSTTIQRRIARRMVLGKQHTLESYAQFLRGNAKELDALYSDVLISVTSFFRNPEAFDVLKKKIFPKFLKQRNDDPVRIWVLGCSTGQEAYSIAMTFMEAAGKAASARTLQVFATDLNDNLLHKARHGLYAKSLAQDIAPERLRRFFVEEQGGYRIIKSLREMVVFARQNLIADPPFSRMDMISCRNLMIYLEPSLQKKALPTFHYALKPEGFLFLGASESIGGFTDLFEPANKKYKIYSKKSTSHAVTFHLPIKKDRQARPDKRPAALLAPATDIADAGRGVLNAQREADRITVNHFAPPGVLINAQMQILQFRGVTSAYLEPPPGKASFDVLKMAREGLMLPLRTAIGKAMKKNKIARQDNVRVLQHGKTRTISIEVVPLKNLRERCFLIWFDETDKKPLANAAAPPKASRGRSKNERTDREGNSRRFSHLEAELSETRDYLQSIQEQHETTSEELQAAHEEVQSANEELQSINEELETSKEELESTNEELITVNEEMASRNTELNRLNSDLINLQASAKLIIVLLGRDLTIRHFSTQAEKQFNLRATDIGRPIGTVRHNLVFQPADTSSEQGRGTTPRARHRRATFPEATRDESLAPPDQSSPDLESLIVGVIADVRERECEVRDSEGRWYSLRVRPYFALDNKVDGAVLVLLDIDDIKHHEQAVAAARDYATSILQHARHPLVVLNADLQVCTANEAFYNTFKVTPAESQGRLLYHLGNHQWDIPRLRELLEDVLPRNSFFNEVEITHDFETIGRRTMLLSANPLGGAAGRPAQILLNVQDITEILQFQINARENADKFKLLFEHGPLPTWAFEPETLRFVEVNQAAIEQYGYRREEFLRMTLLDLHSPPVGATLRAALAAADASLEKQIQQRKKNGAIIEVEMRANAVDLKGQRVWIATLTNVTQPK